MWPTGWLSTRRAPGSGFSGLAPLGAIVKLERAVPLESGRVRVVGTLADATQTVVLYESPEHPMLWPRAVGPPSLIGGASGTVVDDVRVAQLPAVDADVTTIVVSFDTAEGEAVEVELPVERSRTRRHERRAHELPSPVVVDGVTVRVLGAAVGLLTATIDLEITSEDVEIAGVVLGTRMSPRPHAHGRAGAGPLWRDWHPPGRSTLGSVSLRSGASPAGSSARATARASATVTATRTPAGRNPARGMEPPPPGWRVRALPGRDLLAVQGMQGSGGPATDSVSELWTLRFDPPETTAQALELELEELLVYRTGPAEFVSVPPPSSDHPVDLAGFVLSCGTERFHLLRWEPAEQRSFILALAPESRGTRPDVRVGVGDASASLWPRPDREDGLTAALPASHQELFHRDGIPLAVRMVGRSSAVPPVLVQLTRQARFR